MKLQNDPSIGPHGARKIYEDAAALVVDRIQLNYCRVQRRDKPGQFVLTPVWDFSAVAQLKIKMEQCGCVT